MSNSTKTSKSTTSAAKTKQAVGPVKKTPARKAPVKKIAASQRQTSELTTQAADQIRDLGREVRQTGRNLWLAGLGTVAAVGQRRRQVFSDLVQAGESFERQERKTLTAPLRRAGEQARGFGDKVESRFGRGFTSALGRLGVPSRKEVRQLISRIEKLTEKVDALSA